MDGVTFWTAVVALTTMVYAVGTFYLWKSTRNLLRVNILVGLLQSKAITAADFEALLKHSVPEARDLFNRQVVIAI
jgi:hypothetical protein